MRILTADPLWTSYPELKSPAVKEWYAEFSTGLYAFEIGAEAVKVGCGQVFARLAYHRVAMRRYQAPSMGRIVLSIAHSNFRRNEAAVHEKFAPKKIAPEVYRCSLAEIAVFLSGLSYQLGEDRPRGNADYLRYRFART